MRTEYDVIILGAGMVGLVTANLCAQHNLKVALVDLQLPAFNWKPDHIDIRCSAIARASENVLKEIGVWETIIRKRVSPYYRMEVWDALSAGEISFDAAEMGEPDLGHIVENSLIIKSLWEKLLDSDNVTRFIPAKPKVFEKESERIVLQLESGEKLAAKLLVGADGAQSWLRQAAEIKIKSRDYQQKALVATVKTVKAHQATARQCFLKDGILAFLPLSDPFLSSIVWSTSKEKADRLLNREAEDFCKELAYAFDYRLEGILEVGERRAFPLVRQHASNYVADRIALVGDAAHVIHPMAGQGVNLGIYDAQLLVECLIEAKQKNNDMGHLLVLRRYERARKGPNLAMIAGMDFFKQVFGERLGFLQGIRGLGINFINSSKFLKKKLMRQAMGL